MAPIDTTRCEVVRHHEDHIRRRMVHHLTVYHHHTEEEAQAEIIRTDTWPTEDTEAVLHLEMDTAEEVQSETADTARLMVEAEVGMTEVVVLHIPINILTMVEAAARTEEVRCHHHLHRCRLGTISHHHRLRMAVAEAALRPSIIDPRMA